MYTLSMQGSKDLYPCPSLSNPEGGGGWGVEGLGVGAGTVKIVPLERGKLNVFHSSVADQDTMYILFQYELFFKGFKA